jgi:hypothetical protein
MPLVLATRRKRDCVAILAVVTHLANTYLQSTKLASTRCTAPLHRGGPGVRFWPEAALVVGARISQSANQNVGSFVSVCRGPTPLLASWRESKLAVIGDCDQAGP